MDSLFPHVFFMFFLGFQMLTCLFCLFLLHIIYLQTEGKTVVLRLASDQLWLGTCNGSSAPHVETLRVESRYDTKNNIFWHILGDPLIPLASLSLVGFYM